MDVCGTNRVSRFLSACQPPRSLLPDSSGTGRGSDSHAKWAAGTNLHSATYIGHQTGSWRPILLRCGRTRFSLRERFPVSINPWGHHGLTHSVLPAPRAIRNPLQAPGHAGQRARGGSRRRGHKWRGTQCGDCIQTSHVTQPPGKTGGGSSVLCKVSATVPIRGDQIQLLLEGFGSPAQASCFMPTTRPPPGLRESPQDPSVMASLPRADFCTFL